MKLPKPRVTGAKPLQRQLCTTPVAYRYTPGIVQVPTVTTVALREGAVFNLAVFNQQKTFKFFHEVHVPQATVECPGPTYIEPVSSSVWPGALAKRCS